METNTLLLHLPWLKRQRFFLLYWYCLIRVRGIFFVRCLLYWNIRKMGSTVHFRTKPASIFFFMLLYNMCVPDEVRASIYQLNLQKKIHFGLWNIIMMLCVGWKCLKKFYSISSSFLQKITFQNFKYDLMIKAIFNRMYQLGHEWVLETRFFLSSWPWVSQRCSSKEIGGVSYRKCAT